MANKMEDVKNLLQFALNNHEEYWAQVASLGFWFKPWTQILDSSNKPIYKWFIGGETNICYNLLDRHVENGNGDKIATIWESAATKSSGKVTYNELLIQVSKFAGGLQKLNIVKGDVVFIYMANTLELAVAILATLRIGGIVLTLLPNTTANALADRIELSKPKIFITSNETRFKNDAVFFKEPLDEAIIKLNYEAKVIVFQRKEFDPAVIDTTKDILWEDVMQSGQFVQCIPIEATQAALISCSSGTTGKPKGITFSTGGFVTALCNMIWSAKHFAHTSANVTFVPSHPGWMSGVYGIFFPMIGCKCGIIYDGDGTGNGDVHNIYRIIRDQQVDDVIFNIATLRDLRLADPDGVQAKKYNFSCVQSIRAGAEVLDQLSRDWAEKIFAPRILMESWGQTEGPNAVEVKQFVENKDLHRDDREAKFPVPGFAFKIFDEEGKELATGETGFIAAKLPLPPQTVSTLYRNDDLFMKEYFTFPGYFNTKDLGWMDKKGGLHIVGRGDDVMKVSGVTMTTIETENAILKNTDIAECAVVPLKHKEMYMVPIAFYTIKKGIGKQDDAILLKMKEHIKEYFGPAVIFNFALEVNDIAKTLTGKITRKAIQAEMQNLIKEVSHEDNAETILQGMKKAAANLGML